MRVAAARPPGMAGPAGPVGLLVAMLVVWIYMAGGGGTGEAAAGYLPEAEGVTRSAKEIAEEERRAKEAVKAWPACPAGQERFYGGPWQTPDGLCRPRVPFLKETGRPDTVEDEIEYLESIYCWDMINRQYLRVLPRAVQERIRNSCI